MTRHSMALRLYAPRPSGRTVRASLRESGSEMKRIVVGTKGDPGSFAAVAWAADLNEAIGGELVVAAAWAPEEDVGDQETEAARRDRRKELLETELSTPAHRGEAPVKTHLLEGIAREELVRFAVESDASLVVIGPTTDFEHPHRLAKYLVHHLRRPLAVVPVSAAPIGGRTLVVGVDGSSASFAALAWTIDLARDTGSDVAAVFAHDPLADSYPHPDTDNWAYQHEPAVRAELDRASDEGVTVALVRAAGKPVDALTQVARERDAALIAVGTKGHGSLHGLLVGSVPIRLLEAAPVPVVVVPH